MKGAALLGFLLAQRNDNEASAWLEVAAAGNDLRAIFTLGRLLDSVGRHDEAERWWHLAAEAGEPDAAAALGALLVDQGRTAEAEPWLEQALRAH